MGHNDITDAAQSIGLERLTHAAEVSDPLVARAAIGEISAEGIRIVAAAKDTLLTAQGKPAEDPVWETLYDPTVIAKMAAAWRSRRPELLQVLDPIGAISGCRGKVTALVGILKRESKNIGRQVGKLGILVKGLDGWALEKCECPDHYTIDLGGISFSGADSDRLIAHAPIVISRIYTDVELQTQRWTLSWRVGNLWTSTTIDRVDALDNRQLHRQLGNHPGAPVNSGNTSDLVNYLAAFEAKNRGKIPTELCVGHLGWLPKRGDGGGEFVYSPNDPRIRVVPQRDSESAVFRGWGTTEGTWEGWTAIVGELVAPYPAAMLGIYASLVPPLLQLVHADGFTLDWSGETSGGKTTTLMVAGSVWGRPTKRDGVIRAWDASSDIAASICAALLHSLPVILDDTQHMVSPKQREAVANMLYSIPAGEERARGTQDGSIRKPRTWRTCMLTTGESAITSFSNAGGARARALCVRGAPFGSDESAGELTPELARRLKLHHGHMGPRFMRAVSRGIPHLVQRYADLVQHFERATTSKIAGRMSSYVALLQVAAEIAHDCGLPGDFADAIELAQKAAAEGGSEADLPREALVQVLGWARMNSARFLGRRAPDARDPDSGYLGHWPSGSHTLAIEPAACKKLLVDLGHQPDNILASWRERGYIRAVAKSFTYPVRIDGDQVRMTVIDLSSPAVREVELGIAATGEGRP